MKKVVLSTLFLKKVKKLLGGVMELQNIPGIGEKTINNLKSNVIYPDQQLLVPKQ